MISTEAFNSFLKILFLNLLAFENDKYLGF